MNGFLQLGMYGGGREDLKNPSIKDIRIEQTYGIDYKGPRFAVRIHGLCLAKNGEWEWEPIPSSRDGAFIERCRFLTFEDAQAAANTAIENAEKEST